MTKKSKKSEKVTSVDDATETHAFTSLPMKWRDVCYQYAVREGYTHMQIVNLSFKIGKFDRSVHGIAEVKK